MPAYFKNARDPVSSWTHFVGAVGAVLGTILLLFLCALHQKNTAALFSCLIFGLSMVALYTASSTYHYAHGSPHKLEKLRKLDHSMIYVLIAGSYTPICMTFMEPLHGFAFTSAMWLLAFIGIFLKLCWMGTPRWLSTSIYLLMGWAIIFDLPAFQSIPPVCLTLIALGGVAYSIGAVLYILKKPNFSKDFGFHEIFHLFIQLGTLFHFFAVAIYIA